ncbi:PCNA-interacting partner-like [Hydractinia symbiolongicarpus]|uniref:PCNA-interacting partner-like n=1 Tax=Hydractinia symbiolongicarpus TaxID=13093 RepID=UPI002550B899|nr:PCNA-interacting partner-like [Hydractinia symbiolongicarpus]
MCFVWYFAMRQGVNMTQTNHQKLQTYRKVFTGALIKHRSTYLSDVDQIAAIQLSLLLLQKSIYKDVLSPEKLFSLQKKISQRKYRQAGLSMVTTEYSPMPLEMFTFNDIFEAYTDFTKQCNMLDKTDVDIYLRNLKEENCTSLPVQKAGEFLPTSEVIGIPCQSPAIPAQLHLQRIVVGYFQLIVNTRDEIALARVIDAPTRGVDHRAFTEIRKLSHTKGMPMYQVVSSFVRQVNLAGKGYAPSEGHVLFQHRTALQEFMELMDKLQTVVDEAENFLAAFQQMLKVLKTAFIRAKNPVFKSNVVSMVMQDLAGKFKGYIKDLESQQEIILDLRSFLDYMSCITGNDIGVHSSQLCGVLSTPHESNMIFKKISSLATQFKTPEITDETPRKPKVLKEITTPSNLRRIDELRQTPTTSNVEKETVDPLSPDVDIKLIRCCDNFDDAEKTKTNVGKEEKISAPSNGMKRKAERMQPKVRGKNDKVKKKLRLPPGQKTLAQYFS